MIAARRPALIILAAFTGSALASGLTMAWIIHAFLTGPAEENILGQRTLYRVTLLEELQAGETQAVVDKLERKVDNYVSGWDRDPGARGNARTQVAVEKLRAYRASYPRVTDDPQKDAAVRRVLEKR